MKIRLQIPERLQRRLIGVRGWLIPAALLTLAPKCVMCVIAYAGLGTALGLGGPEICGATTNSMYYWIAWVLLIAGAGITFSIIRTHA